MFLGDWGGSKKDSCENISLHTSSLNLAKKKNPNKEQSHRNQPLTQQQPITRQIQYHQPKPFRKEKCRLLRDTTKDVGKQREAERWMKGGNVLICTVMITHVCCRCWCHLLHLLVTQPGKQDRAVWLGWQPSHVTRCGLHSTCSSLISREEPKGAGSRRRNCLKWH